MTVIPQQGQEFSSSETCVPPDAITLSPFYHSAVNEITKPGSLVFVSHYFVDRWARELGPLGAMIVVVLRSYCYHDRKTGELRDQVQRSMAQIAEEIGVSGKTIAREIEAGRALQKFIRVRPEYITGRAAGGLRRDSHSYMVAMDDPVHPSDEARLTEIVRDKARLMDKGTDKWTDKGTDKGSAGDTDAKERARQRKPPLGQFVLAEKGTDKLTPPLGQFVPASTDKLSQGYGQIDRTLIESSESKKNPLNPFPEGSLSLFEETDAPGAPERREDPDAPSAEELQAVRTALTLPPEPPRAPKVKDIQAEWEAMPPEARERFRPEAVRQLRDAGHPAPKEQQVGPTMFKLFWVERKGLPRPPEGLPRPPEGLPRPPEGLRPPNGWQT